jgi:hypothetical protein
MRPGDEVSWCRTIRTGRKGSTDEGAKAAADARPGKDSTVSALLLSDRNDIEFLCFPAYQARILLK